MASSSTSSNPKPTLDAALSGIPKKFRDRIVKSYLEMKKRFSEARFDSSWDTSGLSAGKFCEATFRFLQEHLTGKSIPFGKQIPNFADECRNLISLPSSAGVESLRVIAPRALVFLYTLRGKRGIGHVGGDVEANEIDATTVMRICDWMVCELIRVFHSLSLEEAQGLVDALSRRSIPEIWEVAGKKRVMRTDLSYPDQTLLLLYSQPEEGILSEDLFSWTEHSHLGMYKTSVLLALHKKRLVEYDRDSEIVYLSPTGILKVETEILSKSSAA
jgi:hypothetical protein